MPNQCSVQSRSRDVDVAAAGISRSATGSVADASAPLATARAVKFFADGVIEAGTGFLLEPYENAPHTCGLPNWTAEGLKEAVRTFDADGFQIHIHAIGDAGVRIALDAIEHAARLNGRQDRRPVIAHTQLVHPQDRARFVDARCDRQLRAAVGLPRCLAGRPDAAVSRAGAQLAAISRSPRLARLGARVSFGSDWPVSSHRPLDGLAVAVTRRNAKGEPVDGWVPEERISIMRGNRCVYRRSAFQAFDDDAGTLVVGGRADLVVLDRDITAIAGDEVPGAIVDETWITAHKSSAATNTDVKGFET